jgi:hypothetical protein
MSEIPKFKSREEFEKVIVKKARKTQILRKPCWKNRMNHGPVWSSSS